MALTESRLTKCHWANWQNTEVCTLKIIPKRCVDEHEFSDPLFTLEMYSVFIEMSKVEDSLKRLRALKQLVHQLPGEGSILWHSLVTNYLLRSEKLTHILGIKHSFRREPWSSGYRRQLIFERLWVQIPVHILDEHFSHWSVVKIVIFVRKDRK